MTTICVLSTLVFCFFKQKTAYEMRISDWSSDVCSSDLAIDMKARDAGYLSDLAPRLRAFFLERGILLRPLGNSIYVMPPYAITAEQLMKVFDAIEEAGSLSQA